MIGEIIEGLAAMLIMVSLPWLVPAALEHRIDLSWLDRWLAPGGDAGGQPATSRRRAPSPHPHPSAGTSSGRGRVASPPVARTARPGGPDPEPITSFRSGLGKGPAPSHVPVDDAGPAGGRDSDGIDREDGPWA